MRIGMVSMRLAGLDGVSLEAAKWAALFQRMGHEVVYCAGELDPDGPPGQQEPLFHFRHPRVQALQAAFFQRQPARPEHVREHLERLATQLEERLAAFVERWRIDVLVVENALAIPMHVALGMAISRFLARSGLPAIGHHHDFYWERERFARPLFPQVLEEHFPPNLPNLKHAVINRAAQRALQERKGLPSVVIPNVMDFRQGPPPANGVALRSALGLQEHEVLILQPTRVVPRKGIEWALEVLHAMQQPPHARWLRGRSPVLVISHPAGDEGMAYLHHLQERARALGVRMLYIARHIAPTPQGCTGSGPCFSLWDVYHQADGMTYPSRYEGFGNALLEGVLFRLPILVNRYPIYEEDIRPHGFRFAEMDHAVTPEVVEAFLAFLFDPDVRRPWTEHNYRVALQAFSFESIQPRLEGLLQDAVTAGEASGTRRQEGRQAGSSGRGGKMPF